MANYTLHLKYPFSSVRRLLLGFIIAIIPLVNIAVLGYAIRAIDHLKQKNRTLPPWSDYLHLLKEGIICIILIIPVAIVAVAINSGFNYLFELLSSISSGMTTRAIGIVSLAISLIFFLLF